MVIDCDRCQVRGDRCEDCVVSVLLGVPPELDESDELDELALTPAERRAIDLLTSAGLVRRLRLMPVAEPERGRATPEVA